MARKGLLTGILEEGEFTAVNSESSTESQPVNRSPRGAFGMMSRAADEMAHKVEAAKEIEKKLLAGEAVIDLDPDLLDVSFVADRLDHSQGFEELVQAISERGQDSPILVRPHPERDGRYQIVFGHRRARAAKALGRPVRAVVKKLSDQEHVVAQGQENAARADLSFIERALFAARLSENGFDNQIVMSALSVNKTVVSKMTSVTRLIPLTVIQAIGPARGTGRDRWYDLAQKFRVKSNNSKAEEIIARRKFSETDSDDRFDVVMRSLPLEATDDGLTSGKTDKAQAATSAKIWAPDDGAVKVTTRDKGDTLTLSIKDKRGASFGKWIAQNLDGLYEAFKEAETKQAGD